MQETESLIGGRFPNALHTSDILEPGAEPSADVIAARFKSAEAFIDDIIADQARNIPGVILAGRHDDEFILPMSFSDLQEKNLFLRIARALFLDREVQSYTVISEVSTSTSHGQPQGLGQAPKHKPGVMVLFRTMSRCHMRVYALEHDQDGLITRLTLTEEHVGEEADESFGGELADLLQPNPTPEMRRAAASLLKLVSGMGLVNIELDPMRTR